MQPMELTITANMMAGIRQRRVGQQAWMVQRIVMTIERMR